MKLLRSLENLSEDKVKHFQIFLSMTDLARNSNFGASPQSDQKSQIQSHQMTDLALPTHEPHGKYPVTRTRLPKDSTASSEPEKHTSMQPKSEL